MNDAVQAVLDARNASTRSQIQITVTAQALQAAKAQGAAMVALIESAAAPQGKASGLGSLLDLQG
jgi:hypothetical protein